MNGLNASGGFIFGEHLGAVPYLSLGLRDFPRQFSFSQSSYEQRSKRYTMIIITTTMSTAKDTLVQDSRIAQPVQEAVSASYTCVSEGCQMWVCVCVYLAMVYMYFMKSDIRLWSKRYLIYLIMRYLKLLK